MKKIFFIVLFFILALPGGFIFPATKKFHALLPGNSHAVNVAACLLSNHSTQIEFPCLRNEADRNLFVETDDDDLTENFKPRVISNFICDFFFSRKRICNEFNFAGCFYSFFPALRTSGEFAVLNSVFRI